MRDGNLAPKKEHHAEPSDLEAEACRTHPHPVGKTVDIDDNLNPIVAVNPEGIPEELKELPQWVCWRLAPRGDGEKDEKVPINPRTEGQAKTNNSKTWGTFNQAWDYYQRNKGSGCGGIGFVFAKNDPYVGIDLDGCRDPETGYIEPWAMEIVKKFNSFTEISVSGTGLHIVVKRDLPGGGINTDNIEIYDDRHYFTMTGYLLPGTNPAIEDRQDMVLDLYSRLVEERAGQSAGQANEDQPGAAPRENWQALIPKLKQAVLTPDGKEILRQIGAGQHGEQYQRLYQGDWQGAGYPSHSEADQALCNLLIRLTDGNAGLAYAIFKETGLGQRDKADRLDYVGRTLQKALDGKHWRPDGRADGLRNRLHVVSDRQSEGVGSEDAPGAALEEENQAGCTRTGAAGRRRTLASSSYTCGPTSIRGREGGSTAQAIPGLRGSPGGLGARASVEDDFKDTSSIEGDDISPKISPSRKSLGSAKSPKSSVAATVREIALATTDKFTVDEITISVVKSLQNSPRPTTPEEWRKKVSNALGQMVKQGLLVRIKNGVLCRPECRHENQPQDKNGPRRGITNTRRQAVREACRMDLSGVAGEPHHLLWPLDLHNQVKVYPGNIIVVSGTTDAGKTAIAMNLMLINMNKHQITYISSEMVGEEFVGRLRDFEQAHGLTIGTIAGDKNVEFFECTCEVLSKDEMDKLKALIDPNGINIIDYLEINDEFYKIAGALKEIHNQLRGGLAIVCVQKKSGAPLPLGGDFARHLARVVIVLDHHPKSGLCTLKFIKAKFPARKGFNPKKETIWYEVEDGAKLNRRSAPPADSKKASGASDKKTTKDK